MEIIKSYFIKNLTSRLRNLSGDSKKIVTNFGWLFSEKVLKYGIGAIVGFMVARYLNPTLFGIYSYVTVVFSLFYAIAGLGLQKVVVRNLVLVRSDTKKIIGTSFYLMLVSGVACSILCPLMVYILRPEDTLSVTLVSIMSVSFVFHSLKVIAYQYESDINIKKVVFCSNVAFIVGAVVKVIALTCSLSIIWFVFATALDAILASILLLFIIPNNILRIKDWKYDRGIAKSLLKDSIPLILSALAVNLYMKVDQIMIREMLGDTETGLYAAAVKISNIWLFIPSALFASVYPSLVKIKQENEFLYKQRLQKLYSLSVFMSYAVAVFISIFSNYIIYVTLGDSYALSATYLTILAWGGVFVSLGGARTLFLLSENLTLLYMKTTIIGSIVNIILNFLLIPLYGNIGACISTLVSYSIAALFINFIFKDLRETGFMQLKSLFFPKFW